MVGSKYYEWKKSDEYVEYNGGDVKNITNYNTDGRESEFPVAIQVFENGEAVYSSDVVAMIAGALVSGVASIFINYFITYPFYMSAFGLTEEAIIGMYSEVVALQSEMFGISAAPAVTLWDALIWFNAPFTILKFAACSVVVFFIYKQ